MKRLMAASIIATGLAFVSCGGGSPNARETPGTAARDDPRVASAVRALSVLPPDVAARSEAAIRADPERFFTLLGAALDESKASGGLLTQVDKEHALHPGFEPADLVSLNDYPLSVSRQDLRLRKPVMAAVLAMDEAARKDGVTLVFSSSYRSYAYQDQLFKRYAARYGESEASRFSARPGTSQHQLGTAIDFGSIDDSFAATKAGIWLATNAWRFGFSLSYPMDGEAVTGYVWESWHYRFITRAGAELERTWFGGFQRYTLDFIAAWDSRQVVSAWKPAFPSALSTPA
ncbi:MAG: peptidase M15 [Spirochaetae bacterium HGW-Spirochaetae-7]|jgi:D-alanyl-D-alanine carboxypeptidase|nr:MAG: peptidase M15 [Spirochaetae bacterium HGW-Spirochaetae-7]